MRDIFFLTIAIIALFFSTLTYSATLKFKYDQVGNTISSNDQYFEYNDANQLSKVRKGSPTGPVVAEYIYDYQGQRVKKVENGVTTYYFGKHYEERKGSTTKEQINYYFANKQRIAKKIQTNKDPPKLNYYLNNHLGSADVVIDEQGNEIEKLTYYPFGELCSQNKERYSYTGKEQDEVTNNYYFEARYYSPSIRRFTQPDTITPDLYDPQSLNRYTYTRNSPLVYTDPSGHYIETAADIAFIAYDIHLLASDPSNRTVVNYVALGADVVGALLPGATGLGVGVKAVSAAGTAAHSKTIVKAVQETTSDAIGRISDASNRRPVKGILNFNGLEVRSVKDLTHVDESTLRAMKQHGFAAKTNEGDKIVLHHHKQNPEGFIVEMPAKYHKITNTAQHPYGNTKGAGLTPEQRATFNEWRTDYWKNRATEELTRRGF